MKTAFSAVLALGLVISAPAIGEDDGATEQPEPEWKLATITLRIGTTLKGLVKGKPGGKVYLDDGAGPLPFDRGSVVKIEELSAAEAAEVRAEIAKRQENVAQKRREKQQRQQEQKTAIASKKNPDHAVNLTPEEEEMDRKGREILSASTSAEDRAEGYALRKQVLFSILNRRLKAHLESVKIESKIDYAALELSYDSECSTLFFKFTMTQDAPTVGFACAHFYAGNERMDDIELFAFTGMKKGEFSTTKHRLRFNLKDVTRITIE